MYLHATVLMARSRFVTCEAAVDDMLTRARDW